MRNEIFYENAILLSENISHENKALSMYQFVYSPAKACQGAVYRENSKSSIGGIISSMCGRQKYCWHGGSDDARVVAIMIKRRGAQRKFLAITENDATRHVSSRYFEYETYIYIAWRRAAWLNRTAFVVINRLCKKRWNKKASHKIVIKHQCRISIISSKRNLSHIFWILVEVLLPSLKVKCACYSLHCWHQYFELMKSNIRRDRRDIKKALRQPAPLIHVACQARNIKSEDQLIMSAWNECHRKQLYNDLITWRSSALMPSKRGSCLGKPTCNDENILSSRKPSVPKNEKTCHIWSTQRDQKLSPIP